LLIDAVDVCLLFVGVDVALMTAQMAPVADYYMKLRTAFCAAHTRWASF